MSSDIVRWESLQSFFLRRSPKGRPWEKCGERLGGASRSLRKDSAQLAEFWLPPGMHQSSRRVSGSPFSKSAVWLSSFRVSEMLVNNKKRLFTFSNLIFFKLGVFLVLPAQGYLAQQ